MGRGNGRETCMENASKRWGFQRKSKDAKSSISACTVRETVSLLLANLNIADERAVIPLGHGDPSVFPCFRTPSETEDAIVNAVRSGKYNSYNHGTGLLRARRAVADYLSRDLPRRLTADDVFLTLGCLQAIEVVVSVLDRPGANILFPRPCFPYYDVRAKLGDIEVRHFDLLPEKRWEIDLEGVESLADENTVAMVVINPGNPCGCVYSYQHLRNVAARARELGVMVICDETYGHMTFGRTPFVPMGVFGSIVPVITLGSLSKRWAVPGWRLGWLAISDTDNVLGDSGIVDSIKKIFHVIPDPPTFIQAALPEILESTREEYFLRTINILKEGADICHDGLRDIRCITCYSRPEGSMFLMAKVETSKLESITDDSDFCVKLAREESVIVLPGSVMGMKNWIRLTFAANPSILVEGLRRIKVFCERHTKAT